MDKWDRRFINIAKEISTWSKDPSTKVGAVIVSPDRDIVSTGYNGFPRNVEDCTDDYDDRDKKYLKVVHAEMNAIIRAKKDISGHTLYVYPIQACPHCAASIIQTGIKRIVALDTEHERLSSLFPVSRDMFEQAGISVTIYSKSSFELTDGGEDSNVDCN